MGITISRRHLVGLIYLFLCFGFVPIADAVGFSEDSRGSRTNVNPIIGNDLHVFMSQDSKDASDVTITMEKPTPSPQSYLDWRDLDWNDPFVEHGQVKVHASLNTPTNSDVPAATDQVAKSDSTMKLELRMPSSTSIITSDSFDDLEDPFMSKLDTPDIPDPFEDYNRFMFDFNEGFYDNLGTFAII